MAVRLEHLWCLSPTLRNGGVFLDGPRAKELSLFFASGQKLEMRRARTGVDEQGQVEQQRPGPVVRAMRASRCCQDVAPRDGCGGRVRWLLAVVWANLLCYPSVGVSAPFLVAQKGQVLGAPLLLQAWSRQPMI